MLFKKKGKTSQPQNNVPKEKDLTDILEEKSKKNSKLDNLSEELIAKAIKDILSKE